MKTNTKICAQFFSHYANTRLLFCNLFFGMLLLSTTAVWGGTRRIYLDYSLVTWWTNDAKIDNPSYSNYMGCHAWNNSGSADYSMERVPGESYLLYCDIDDSYTSLLFFRCTELSMSSGSLWDQTQNWGEIGSYNRFKIKDAKGEYDDDEGKVLWADSNAAIRWTPGVAVDGLIDVHNPHAQAFSFTGDVGVYTVTLSAHATYQFNILDGSTRYTLDNNVWTSTISNYTLSTSGYDIRLATAAGGTYTFMYNKSSHQLSVTYPSVTHPSIDYCYLYGYNGWTNHYLNIWGSTSGIEGTSYPGTDMYNYFTKDNTNFYYFAPGDYTHCEPNDNAEGRKVPDCNPQDGYGKYLSHDGSSWGWRTWSFTIELNEQATTISAPVDPTVEFNGAALPSITPPTRVGYVFAGYWSNAACDAVKVIDESGAWVANALGYTSDSKWIHEGGNATLYAKWTAMTISAPVVTTSDDAYSGSDITLNMSATTEYVSDPVVIFYVNDGTTTFEVVGTPGAIGSAPLYTTTHTATFTATKAATYRVTAKVFRGKLIDNFDSHLAYWKALENSTINISASNPAVQAGNGSNTVMKITRGDAEWKAAQTKKAENDESNTNWNYDYSHIYISMYSTFSRATKMKYSDEYGSAAEVTSDELTADTWTRVHFARASADHQIDYILPFMLWEGDMWIDDIILSNDELTVQATSDETSATIYQATISTPSVVADSAYYLGGPVAIRLHTVSTGVKEPVVMFYVNDGTETYQVLAAPGSVGEAATEYSTAHSATFYATKAATYTAYAVLYEGKFIDNFEDMASAWSGLGYGTCARVANIEREPANGSNKVMKIMRNTAADSEVFNTAWTTTAEGSGEQSGWDFSYSYIHMRYYAPQPETPTVEYYNRDEDFRNTSVSDVSANTWHRLTFEVNGGVVDHIHPFVSSGEGNSIYIDDIVLSNEEEMTAILTSGSSAVTIRRPFIIYRTGDKEGDARAKDGDVESYEGGTIDRLIEYRMKVRALDQWYSLCLPFDVQAVQVWDAEDGKYYDIVPYFRMDEDAETIYKGHYFIRKPNCDNGADFPMSQFGEWKDPISASIPTGYRPTKNTPYIIQWHDPYFFNSYISFFGRAGQTIPSSMTQGASPSVDNVVRVYGNDAMKGGSVPGAYMLDAGYGNGAWLRGDDPAAESVVLPFECYIRASSTATGKYMVIRRGMTIEDTATGWDDVLNSEYKSCIKVYTLAGFPVAQYDNCSFAEAAQRLRTCHHAGLYILRAGNESVKVMVGGK